ncbi:MAG: ABC transporter ATP-binding protein [Tissierellia bacterium]|nr:ABC transporter ATP-binding protein [Tissierellia bacterium]
MTKIIEIKDLNFSYTDTPLLQGLNLTVNKGDFVGITGPNGSGKSTLLKLITGQLNSKDSIIVEGGNLENVGYVPQSNVQMNITFPITCQEVVQLNLYREMGPFKIPGRKVKEKATMALQMVGMAKKKRYNFNTLSGGEKQRVMIAKALVAEPKLLIFDEPTAGIDAESKEILYRILKHLNEHHQITILVVTHELEGSRQYFQRILRLDQGKIKEVSV